MSEVMSSADVCRKAGEILSRAETERQRCVEEEARVGVCAEGEAKDRRIAELEAALWHHEIPFGLYRGSCGHYWDSAEVGIERCPVCAELAEERARLDAYVNAAEAYILRLRRIVYSGVDTVKSNTGMEITRLDLAGDVERAKAAIDAARGKSDSKCGKTHTETP